MSNEAWAAYRLEMQQREEAHRRALNAIRHLATDARAQLDMLNVGSAKEVVDHIRDLHSDEFGSPLIFQQKLEEVTG